MHLGGKGMDNPTIEKVIIPISECVPGMKIMQSIIDLRTGTTIIAKEQILTEEIIDKIKNFEHSQVWIATQEETSVWQISPQVLENYKGYAKVLREILTHTAENNEALSMNQMIELADSMATGFKRDYELLSCMHLMNQLEKDAYNHSINVAFLSLLIGRWEGYEPDKLKDLVLAALLHDIGKILISPHLMHKKEDEMNVMEKLEFRRHTIYGYEKLSEYDEMSVDVLKGVLSHHERCDGSGYPLSIKENRLNDFAKIIGITDTYEELKKDHHIFEVVRRLGSTMLRKFEVHLLFEFCNNIMNYYIGASVLLNNGEVGEVLFIQSQAWGRPIVEVNGKIINLYEKNNLQIVKVL